MKNKEISYEIIDFSGETNVQFRTSVDPGSYIPSQFGASREPKTTLWNCQERCRWEAGGHCEASEV